MRLLVLLLVLANVAFYAWWRYLAPPEESGEPGRIARQIDPGKLPAVPAPREAAAASLRPVSGTCMDWGGFMDADLSRAEQALEPLGLRVPPLQRRVDESAAWWVYIPSPGSRDAAQKKAAELKALGIEDYFIVQDAGPTRWSLSLGVFRSEESARNRLDSLRAKRIGSARIGTRDTHVLKVWLQARELTPEQLERLRTTIVKQFAGTELRECAKS